MSDLVKIARARVTDFQQTHWEGCERDHRECLIQRMADEIDRLRGLLCKCNMRTRLVGDGCEFCNPQLAEELARDQR
jgi:hypothetical protein